MRPIPLRCAARAALVAAPTAGLHFTPALLEALADESMLINRHGDAIRARERSLAELLDVKRNQVALLSGEKSRTKEFRVELPVAEVRDYTRTELTAFDGKDPTVPVLIGIRGHVYDVTRGRSFYGAGGPYDRPASAANTAAASATVRASGPT